MPRLQRHFLPSVPFFAQDKDASGCFIPSSLVPANGAAAPTPTTPIAVARTVASAAATTTSTTAATASGLAWGWSHKGKVHLNGLVEELRLVGTVDGGARLLKRRILNQCVALFAHHGTT